MENNERALFFAGVVKYTLFVWSWVIFVIFLLRTVRWTLWYPINFTNPRWYGPVAAEVQSFTLVRVFLGSVFWPWYMAFIRFFFAFSQKKINLLTARPNYFSPFRIFIFSIFDFLKKVFIHHIFKAVWLDQMLVFLFLILLLILMMTMSCLNVS